MKELDYYKSADINEGQDEIIGWINHKLNHSKKDSIAFAKKKGWIRSNRKESSPYDLNQNEKARIIEGCLNLNAYGKYTIILRQEFLISELMVELEYYEEKGILILAKRAKVLRNDCKARRINWLSYKQAGRIITWLQALREDMQSVSAGK